MKIRRKIAYILAAACLVGDAMIITLWQPWYLKQSLAREQLVMQGHLVTLGDAVTPYLLQNQLAAIHEILDTTLARQTEWRSLELRDSSGQLIYPLDIVDTRGLAQALHLTYVIELRHARLATLALVVDQSGQIAALKRNIWMTLAFVTLGVALVGLFIGTTLEIVVGRRARALVAGAERIARGDHGHPIADASEDEIGQVARAFDDMSDAIAANEKQLIEARLAAENSNLAKSAFLANMSHEIRTPMNGILGMAQLLLMPGLNARERDDYARTILGSGQSLLALLNDILDLSKVEAGHLDIEPEAVLPGDILRDIEALYAQGAQQKGLSLVSAWSGPGGQHYALDPQRLRQMLGNLVGNAIKFCAQGAIRVEGREVAVHGEHAMLEFTVTDSGPGIARDKQDLLFKPFSQVDSSITRKYGGTGLGLSIVRSLAQLMQGEVGVESAEGLGARFWFRIQAARVAPPEAGTASRDLAAGAQASDTHPLTGRVMVVEDNRSNRKVAESLLGKLGLTVILCEDGRQCLEALERGEHADLVLMDLQMPVMDGLEAARAIRAREAAQGLPRLPVIALTANAYEQDRERCLAAGMDDFLAKPIVFAQLRQALARRLPAGTPAPAALPTALATVERNMPDLALLRAHVPELLTLLAENRFDALGRYNDLYALLAGTTLAARLDDMRPLLEQFRFEQARDILVTLARAEGWIEA